ncbi:bifunctional riboflavin kinase/FAD synthetase [Myxacorys almedinensis]|uniref:Riboflavin biosynthesis protein n=1 Tax=Myxacorys almedinensis A TaxID=2690445 RepID=A0A8J7YZG1_9CYAN|nr:bifunctional riboflavin kinase/FAD synthetase [Myxacorys almedinensis A]
MWITSSPSTALTPTAVALGNFDGIHLGHRQVVLPVLDTQTSNRATVVTFSPHPKEFFTGQPRSLLTPLDEKAAHLESIGIAQLVMLPFTQALAALSPQQFVEEVLVRHMQAQQVSIGADFRFGCKRAGTAEDLSAIAASYGISTTIVPLLTFQGKRISSSSVRDALLQGDLATANRMLGRSYRLSGQVVKGQQLGHTIGFPTANLQPPANKLIPRQGVYGVRVSGEEADSVLGVMNIGNRPTVNGLTQTIEVHLLDWAGDLYGQTLTVELEEFIRPEQKFASLEELQTQINLDCETARTMLAAIS